MIDPRVIPVQNQTYNAIVQAGRKGASTPLSTLTTPNSGGSTMAHQSQSCSVDGCNRTVRCKGVCSKHYCRLRLYGSPTGGDSERASQIAVAAFLEVVRVYDGMECLIWPFAKDNNGYARANRDGIPHAVHRWACELQNGPAPADKPEAAHSCARGSHGCVAKPHLRWADRSGNQAEMVLHGNSTRGAKHPQVVLTEDDVRTVRRMLGTKKQKEIGAQFGVSQATISLIACGKNWGWLDG